MVLSVAGRWVAAVYAVHHLPSDPPGPRFMGRDATLLHRLLWPLVAGEPAQAVVPSGKGVGVGVFPARSVVHPKTEVLEGQEPPRHPGVPGAGHPFQRGVIGDQGELPT